ncbi:hypothetical protein PO909_020530 [Leuciscus waleckii]
MVRNEKRFHRQELIKRNKFQGFSLPLVRKFAHSILQCLEALHRHKIIHCDLKPENILLKQQGRSGIKVIDFGSSCFDHQRVYTYIQSRFYRAPELLEQAKRAKNFISSKGHPRPPGSKEWGSALKGCDDPTFIDFLKKCLDWDPSTRMTPVQALRHPWLYKRLPKPAPGGEKSMLPKRITEHSTTFPTIISKVPPVMASTNNKLRTTMMGDSTGSIPFRTVLPKLVS